MEREYFMDGKYLYEWQVSMPQSNNSACILSHKLNIIFLDFYNTQSDNKFTFNYSNIQYKVQYSH